MPGLTTAMSILKTTFQKYAGKEGDINSLTKAELAELLRNELPGASANKDKMTKFFNDLDCDKDGVVDFQEYVTFVAALTVLCDSC